jgi:threonine dehydratase
MALLPKVDDVYAARERIGPYIRSTPVILDDAIAYKFEFLQHTGSFKVRGAFNAVLQLDAATRARGIVGVSGGNHGLALAYVGHALGIRATIFMPQTTPDYAANAARHLGADVRLTGTIADSMRQSAEMATNDGLAYLHPFDDVDVIAGQGTIGLEILEQFPNVRRVIISIGGGGLLAGIALVLKAYRPDITVIGVETKGADAMHQALEAGHIVELPAITSIARTLGAPAVCERTLLAARTIVDSVVVVDDRDAVAGIVELQERLGVTVEPAAACNLAAIRTGAIPETPDSLIVLCGRNVRLGEIARWSEALAP